MKIWTLASVMVVLASAFGGSGEARAQEAVKETTQFAAQPPLPTVHLVIKGKSILAEVADEPHEQQAGLIFRDKLATDSGMLFIMSPPRRAAFWMKNTSLPLSLAYIDRSGRILEIHDLEPFTETTIPSAFPNVAYALEMNRDWFRKQGILAGDRLSGLPRPPLQIP